MIKIIKVLRLVYSGLVRIAARWRPLWLPQWLVWALDKIRTALRAIYLGLIRALICLSVFRRITLFPILRKPGRIILRGVMGEPQGVKIACLASFVIEHAYERTVDIDVGNHFLATHYKRNRVIGFFYSGRSGSYLLHSFFNDESVDNIVTIPVDGDKPVPFMDMEMRIHPSDIAIFNEIETKNDGRINLEVAVWCSKLLTKCGDLIDVDENDAALASNVAPVTLFHAFLLVQLSYLKPEQLNYEKLIKIIFNAYGMARKKPINFSPYAQLLYIWQAHVALWDPETQWPLISQGKDDDQYSPRRQWLKLHFPSLKTVTIVRLPEKALDSHIMHHVYENVSPPLVSLLRRMLFDSGMVWSNDLLGNDADCNDYVVRFEDLHANPEFVVRKVCEFGGVNYSPRLGVTALPMDSQGRKLQGTRRLTEVDFETKMLSQRDVTLVRNLMEGHYRAWGYENYCKGETFQESISTFASKKLCFQFEVQKEIGKLHSDQHLMVEEDIKIRELCEKEGTRRRGKLRIIPLLYDIDDLNE